VEGVTEPVVAPGGVEVVVIGHSLVVFPHVVGRKDRVWASAGGNDTSVMRKFAPKGTVCPETLPIAP